MVTLSGESKAAAGAGATTITSNANNLQAVLGLLCAHPNFQRR